MTRSELPKLKAIFFDLGDTLINSRIFRPNGELKAIEKVIGLYRLRKQPANYLPLIEGADKFLSSLIENGRRPGESLQEFGVRVIRAKHAKLIELMGGEPGEKSADLVFKAHLNGIATALSLFPEVEDVLDVLRERYRLGLLSNNISEYARGPVAHLCLERFFEVIIISGEENVRKPDPEIFHRASKRMGVDISEAMMVGDSPVEDINGAKNAGMVAVWVNRSDKELSDNMKPDYIICNMRELLDII